MTGKPPPPEAIGYLIGGLVMLFLRLIGASVLGSLAGLIAGTAVIWYLWYRHR